MKNINVLSWGGGTQSTALLVKFLKKEILDTNNKPIELDYIMFADTKNEPNFVYSQVFKVQRWVKEKFGKEIVISKRNKVALTDEEVIERIQEGKIPNYRISEYADLFQSHVLFFKGIINSIDIMPLWTRNPKTGKIGKTKFKQCTFEYKILQILREIRELEGLKRFDKRKQHVNFFIGYSVDEISRVKPNPKSYATNHAPLVDIYWSKSKCIEYVEEELGFTPISSVCNMCYANDFDRVIKIYREDKIGWNRLLDLDNAMANKPNNHSIKEDPFMFRWQAILNVRLKDIDMEELAIELKDKNKQMSIFEMEEAMACMGGCFL
jgi:hypothetical protein